MSNKISFSCSESVDVDVDVSFAVVCAKCNSPLESEYNQRTGTLFVSNCNKCMGKAFIASSAIMEEARAKFGEEVFQFLDLKRMLQE